MKMINKRIWKVYKGEMKELIKINDGFVAIIEYISYPLIILNYNYIDRTINMNQNKHEENQFIHFNRNRQAVAKWL